ncbi:Diacylglycerol kinase catalytic domain [Seminavis robusta]|uniref:Diacylglycerol kinase catalytic domain n=1 Tax=Seminavis robusta TaxID=568900 RepID=A0A9N8H3E3_9STRA|nr:Diacylglycerol kinase catalytic domain [Seminavis robusta]|eukprot:Sro25_g016830.1 Diacylglycerol kinase catalytic domain (500) ;mRNA; f:48441-49940
MMRRRSCLVTLLLTYAWAPVSSGLSALSPPPANSNSNVPKEISEFQSLEKSAFQLEGPSETANNNGVHSNGVAKKTHAAIVLNTNARGVSQDLVPVAESIFGKAYVFVTNTEEEGKVAAAKIMQPDSNISMIIPVGGDGTLSSMINFLCGEIMKNNPEFTSMDQAMQALPLVAYVPLGTGNGVGSVVGSEMLSNPPWQILGQKRRKLRQLRRMLTAYQQVVERINEDPNFLESTENTFDLVDLPMMEVSYPDSKKHDDTLCFFAGAGFDSLMLQDFQSIKKWAIRTKFLTKTLSSVAGYCVALVVKTLPKCVARQEHNIHVKVTTRDPDCLWVDHRRGDVVQSVGPTTTKSNNADDDDTVLYEGTTGILAAGTSPFYGGGLRLFPFARITKDKMHLRLGRIHPLRGFFNIPQIFEGSFRDKSLSSFGCLDYIGGDFDIFITSTVTTNNSTETEETKGFPVQHSGESVGYFERFRLRVVKTPVRFLTLMEKRVIREEQRK